MMKTLFSFILASLAAHLSAQPYSVTWSRIAGGGVLNSTGGVYAVSGTIGQHDAGGPMTGGQYSVTGGFWASPTAVQTPGAPLLSIEALPGGVRVFWPVTATGFILEEALESPPPATLWSLVPVAIYQTNATEISITVSPAVGSTFYRLRRP